MIQMTQEHNDVHIKLSVRLLDLNENTVLKNFLQNKIWTGKVVGHRKYLHEWSGRREKGKKVQYINK